MAKQQVFITRGMAFSTVQSKSLVQSKVLNCHRKVWCREWAVINTVKLFDCRTSDIFFHRQIQMVPDVSTCLRCWYFFGFGLWNEKRVFCQLLVYSIEAGGPEISNTPLISPPMEDSFTHLVTLQSCQ